MLLTSDVGFKMAITLKEHQSKTLDINLDDIPFEGQPERDKPPKLLGTTWDGESLTASYYVGTAWLKDGEPLLVNPKVGGLDLPRMFGRALGVASKRESDYFSKCYGIESDQKAIDGGMLAKDFLLLLVMHFISLMKNLTKSGLRSGYITAEENIQSKIKGRVLVPRNIVRNDLNMRSDRIYCSYQEYTKDIPENRLLKKALLLSESILNRMSSFTQLNVDMAKLKTFFSEVSDTVDEHTVRGTKSSKLFKGYNEALKVARIILREEANNTGDSGTIISPFWIDMSGLFELYVYSLLDEAYSGEILFQVSGSHKTRCDYVHKGLNLVMDAKYKFRYSPNIEGNPYGLMDDIREISGYARDKRILAHMNSTVPLESFVPECLIIYPKDDGAGSLADITDKWQKVNSFVNFYTVGVKLPAR